MTLHYYYSDKCKHCVDYQGVASSVAKRYGLDLITHNIEQEKPAHDVKGIPYILIEDDGNTVFTSIGNLAKGSLIKEIDNVL